MWATASPERCRSTGRRGRDYQSGPFRRQNGERLPIVPSFETLLRRALLTLTLVLPCLLGFLTTYVLLLLLLVTLVHLLLRRGERALRLDLAGKLLLAGFAGLAVLIALSATLTGRPHDLIYALDFGMLILYAPLASIYGRGAHPHNSVAVADLALAGVALAFAIGVVEKLVYHPERVGNFASDPIRYADTAVILGFLTLSGLISRTTRWRWAFLAGPPLALGAVLLSGSRSALLAFPLMLIIAAAMLVPHKRVALGIGAAAVAIFAALFALADWLQMSRAVTLFDIARNLVAGGAVADDSARQRFALYRAGLEAFRHSPWIGTGWHRRMEVTEEYLDTADKGLASLPHLHDEVLNFAVGSGVVGVAIYFLLLLTPIIACLRSPRDSQYRMRLYGCVMLMGSYFTLGLADVMIGFELHTALFVALTALLLSYCRDQTDATNTPPVPVEA